MDIKNKKILIIMPKFFGYEIFIKKQLEEYGANVVLLYDSIEHLFIFYRILKKISKKLFYYFTYIYYKSKLHSINNDIDYLLVIRGASLNPKIMNNIISTINIKYKILYLWDGIRTYPNILNLFSYFDKVLTFDIVDSKKYGIYYRPLFYISDLIESYEPIYDFLYICSVHTNRIKIANQLINYCDDMKMNAKIILVTNKLYYLYKRFMLRDKDFRTIDKKYIIFKPLKVDEVYKYYSKAKIIIDYTNPIQTGLTMRTIECLGYNKKIITNNMFIKKTDIYSDSNDFFYYDELVIDKKFIYSTYCEHDKNIFDKYSLKSFIKDIFR